MGANISTRGLIGKIYIKGILEAKTGLHIGGNNDFSAIGAVDTVVVRDPVTRRPYIPGSSLKGKMRYLLTRVYAKNGMLKDINKECVDNPDDYKIMRLFGSSSPKIVLSRLQFWDIFLNKESVEKLLKADTDLYLTEIKYENTISRITSVANPRQIERVPSGALFDFSLVYNIEDEDDLEEDMKNTGYAMMLLEHDYLGGHGSRGYGKVQFVDNMMHLDIKLFFADYDGKICDIARQAFEKGRKGEI